MKIHGVSNLIGSCQGQRAAIIGTGPSAENVDYEALSRDFITIGLNEAAKLLRPDFLCFCDVKALPKTAPYIEPGTDVIISLKGYEYASKRPELLDAISQSRLYVCQMNPHMKDPTDGLFYTCGILTAGLSLACVLDVDEAVLIGADFYRTRESLYAFDLSPPRPDMLRGIPGTTTEFSTDALGSMAKSIDSNASAWMEVSITNWSPRSRLRSWPKCDPPEQYRRKP